MKIAFIGQKGIPARQGGVEKHAQELSIRLAKAGFEVSVYSRKHYTLSNLKTFEDVNITYLPSINTKHLDAITHSFLATCHALWHNYDVIHYHGVGPSLLSWMPRLFRPGTKVIATFHSIDREHQKWGRLARFFLTLGEWTICRFPHETIVISKSLQKYCWERFKKNARYIPNGVAINDKGDDTKILSEFGITKNNYILAVSRLIKHKGLHFLIDAYERLQTKKKLLIAGENSNTQDYSNDLKKKAKNNRNIIFAGQRNSDELAVLYKNASLFVQPSETEGLSISLLEAISNGVPVIVSDIEGNKEVVGNLGLIFESKNALDLANKINFAFYNETLIRNNALVLQKQIEEKYNWKDIAAQTIEIYSQLSKKTPELLKSNI